MRRVFRNTLEDVNNLIRAVSRDLSSSGLSSCYFNIDFHQNRDYRAQCFDLGLVLMDALAVNLINHHCSREIVITLQKRR